MRRPLTALLALTCLAVTARAADKPRVLILGDSISIGYTPDVQKMLADEAVVLRPMRGKGAENCAGTTYGVKNIDRWLKLGTGKWDVIHFNFGLHDLKHVNPKTGRNSNNPADPRQAEPAKYEKQLREIVGKLKKTGAKLIFATTTPVPPGGVKPYRDVKDPARYNAIALEVMKENGVAVNDLYAFALPRLKKIQRPVNVHFTPEGSRLLAGEVVKHIRKALGKPKARAGAARPNILWIIVEDMSAHFGCYGEKTIETPNVDRLAAEGVKFTRAFITAPVCSPSRSAMITGMYQTSIGAHHHRSGRGKVKIHLPEKVRLVPALFQKAGYYTCNGTIAGKGSRPGKTDYNFEWDRSVYDGADWSARKAGQPFFAQVQLRGGKLRHARNWASRAKEALGSLTRPEEVTLPPYYPRDPVILEDWARYLDTVRYTDREVGQLLKRLEDEGIADNTYVFFITDHGISHARGKQFCYDEGVHIPFIVRGPGLKAGTVRDDLIQHIDMAATSLALAGIGVPKYMEARDVFAAGYRPREFVVCARDRCDETVDRIRAVRTKKYKYIRNFYPQRPYLQPNRYKDAKEILVRLRELYAAGKLKGPQKLQMASTRPAEELYDLEKDPHEIHNLADDPAHQETLKKMRDTLARWIKETGDRGQKPEPEAMYDSDMDVYLKGLRRGRPKQAKILEENIRVMKRWEKEGK